MSNSEKIEGFNKSVISCGIMGKKFFKKYVVVYKYKNKIGYFINVIGINKRDVRKKVRVLVYHSNFFYGLKNKNDVQVIVIENND